MRPTTRLYCLVALLIALVLGSARPAHAQEHDEEDAPAAVDPEADVDLKAAPPATNHHAYGEFLRLALRKARPHVLEKVETKMVVGQEKAMGRFSTGLFFFSLLGVLLVFRPVFLLRKFPGRAKTLFGYGLLSGGLFFLTVNLFATVLGLLRFAQGAAGRVTNPQVAILEASFDVLDRNADDLAELGPKLIEPSLHRLAQGDTDFVVVLLENLKSVKGDIQVIVAIAKAMKAFDGLLAWIPIVLTVVAVVTFALSAKDTLLAIVRLPETAASGGSARDVVRLVLRRVKGELFATLCLVGVLTVLTILSGLALRAAVEPAVESFLSTLFLAAVYIQTAKVSSAVLFGSLALAASVLVLNLGVVMAATAGALGKLHKIFQRKFHDGVPLSAHGRFWKRAPVALATCFLFPLAYDWLAEKGVEKMLEHTLEAEHPSLSGALVGTPCLLVVGFVVAFALVWGFHSLIFLFRYPAMKIAADDLAVFDRLVFVSPDATIPMPTMPTSGTASDNWLPRAR